MRPADDYVEAAGEGAEARGDGVPCFAAHDYGVEGGGGLGGGVSRGLRGGGGGRSGGGVTGERRTAEGGKRLVTRAK